MARSLSGKNSNKTIKNIVHQVSSNNTILKGIRFIKKSIIVTKLNYVRYINSWLFGFKGYKKDALQILIHISNFLSIYLGLNIDLRNSRVTDHREGILFLGYKI